MFNTFLANFHREIELFRWHSSHSSQVKLFVLSLDIHPDLIQLMEWAPALAPRTSFENFSKLCLYKSALVVTIIYKVSYNFAQTFLSANSLNKFVGLCWGLPQIVAIGSTMGFLGESFPFPFLIWLNKVVREF